MSGERDDEDAALVRAAKPDQTDAAASLIRAGVKRKLLGVDVPSPKLGRFTLLELVGEGAMGTVYAAYDPVLDRRVALKVLRADSGDVIREARALAKLAHPNVLAVFEADRAEETAYLATEYVEGGDLRSWLAREAPTWDRVVEVLAAAGAGLAAAHAAGIVHSDFKPENVLVGRDRVRVADFGVARAVADAGRPGGGTPGYMAPEQLRGEEPTPKSDQFSFAVTLLEALTGERPFQGDTTEARLEAIQSGARIPTFVPPPVRRALERALSPDPGARFPSMDELLEALQPAKKSSRTALLVGAAGLIVAAFFIFRQPDPCYGGAAMVDGVWNEETRSAVTRSVRSTGPYGEEAAARITAAVETFRSAWIAHHREVCEATRLHRTQSDSAYDARMACLDRKLDALESLADAMRSMESTAEVARAVGAAADLPRSLDRCRSPEPFAATPEVRWVLSLADRSRLQYRLGQYRAALATARRAVKEAESLDDPSALAHALFAKGAAEGRTLTSTVAETTLENALLAAARSGQDTLIADLWMWIVRDRLFRGRYQQVIDWAPFARSAAARAKIGDGALDGVVGEALLARGSVQEAIDVLERALADEDLPPDRRAITLTTLGSARLAAGAPEAADRSYADALAIMRTHLGESHPGLGFYYEKLGRSRRALERPKEALDFCLRSLAIREGAYGTEDRAVATSALCAAEAELSLNRVDDAKAHLETAQRIRMKAYGPNHPSLARIDLGLAEVAIARRDWPRARSALEEAIRVRRPVSPEHPEIARAYRLMASVAEQTGSKDEARTLSEEAARIEKLAGE